MRVIVEQLVEWRLAGETEVHGENLSQRHFVHHKIPHDQARARTPARRGGKPATNRLSYVAAFIMDLTVPECSPKITINEWHVLVMWFLMRTLDGYTATCRIVHIFPSCMENLTVRVDDDSGQPLLLRQQ
jgi:hypothetical protein